MDRPVQLARLVCAVVCATPIVRSADEVGPEAKRERAVSARTADILAAATPPYTPPADATSGNPTKPAVAVQPRVTQPANTIVRLPDYIVREQKPKRLPEPEEVMVPRDLARLAMNEFIGPETGLDRGVLNLVTLPQLWKKIPLLGQFPLEVWETNEERGMRLYRADRAAKHWAEAMSLLTPEERAAIANPTGSAPPRK